MVRVRRGLGPPLYSNHYRQKYMSLHSLHQFNDVEEIPLAGFSFVCVQGSLAWQLKERSAVCVEGVCVWNKSAELSVSLHYSNTATQQPLQTLPRATQAHSAHCCSISINLHNHADQTQRPQTQRPSPCTKLITSPVFIPFIDHF